MQKRRPVRPPAWAVFICKPAFLRIRSGKPELFGQFYPVTRAIAAASIGTVRAFSPAMLMRLSPTM